MLNVNFMTILVAFSANYCEHKKTLQTPFKISAFYDIKVKVRP